MNRPLIRNLLIVGLTAFALAAYAGVRISTASPVFNGTEYPDSPPAPPFTLQDHTGGTSGLIDYRGRSVLLFFGYTTCPDVCPMTLSRLSRVLEETGLVDRVSILLVTVDPVHDTEERLAEYVARFGPAVTGLRPDPVELDQLLREYGVFAQRTAGHDARETLAHTDVVFGIDRSGRLRVLMHPDGLIENLEQDIRALARIRG